MQVSRASNGHQLTISCSMDRANSICGDGLKGNSMRLQKTATKDQNDDSFQDIAVLRDGNNIQANTGSTATVTGGFNPYGKTHVEYRWSSSDRAAVGRYRCQVTVTCCAIVACMDNTVYSHDTVVVGKQHNAFTTQVVKTV